MDKLTTLEPLMKKIVFLHIPKTGGTSVHEFLVTKFNSDEVCPERFNNLESHPKEELSRYYLFSGHYDMSGVNHIDGDKDIIAFFRDPKDRILSLYYFWKAHRWSTIEKANLNGPRLAKSLSLLEFLRYPNEGIPANIDNYYARVLAGKMYCGPNRAFLHSENEMISRSMTAIDSMSAIGVMEDFATSYRFVLSRLGYNAPPAIPHARNSKSLNDPSLEPVEREAITTDINNELDRLTRLDTQIYNYALQKLKQDLKSAQGTHLPYGSNEHS